MFSLKKQLLQLCYYTSLLFYISKYTGNGNLFLFPTSGVYVILAMYFCLFFHMYYSKKMIRHYVSLNFRIVIQYHLSDYYVLSKIKYKSQKLLSNFQKTRKKKNMKKQKKILSIYYIHALVQRRKKHNRVTKYMRNKK